MLSQSLFCTVLRRWQLAHKVCRFSGLLLSWSPSIWSTSNWARCLGIKSHSSQCGFFCLKWRERYSLYLVRQDQPYCFFFNLVGPQMIQMPKRRVGFLRSNLCCMFKPYLPAYFNDCKPVAGHVKEGINGRAWVVVIALTL